MTPIHLERDPRDTAQGFAVSMDFLDHFIGAADQQRTLRTALRIEARACDGRPSTLFADIGDGAGVTGKEGVGGVLRRLGDVAERVNADLQPIR